MTEKNLRGTYKPDDYTVDYDALEHLLLGIIDAVRDTGMERKKRLRVAYEALTGVRIDRVDEPDSVDAKALAEYYRLEEENFRNQELPEFGGPTDEEIEANSGLEEKSEHDLAHQAAKKFEDWDEKGNLWEPIYKRVQGRYNNQRIQRNPLGYTAAVVHQHYDFDSEALSELHSDLTDVAAILSKHNILMDLSPSFWRLQH